MSYSPEDVITRVIDAEFGEDSAWAGGEDGLCPDCCHKVAVNIRAALESEDFVIVPRARLGGPP